MDNLLLFFDIIGIMVEVAALIATIIFVGLIIFQILLITGAPIGRFAWGGYNNVLPTKLKIGSVFSIILYIFFILIILNQSGIIKLFGIAGWANIALIIITIYFFIGIVMNALSKSKSERYTMTPIAATLALLFLYIYINT
jgi:hypothetical protein